MGHNVAVQGGGRQLEQYEQLCSYAGELELCKQVDGKPVHFFSMEVLLLPVNGETRVKKFFLRVWHKLLALERLPTHTGNKF